MDVKLREAMEAVVMKEGENLDKVLVALSLSIRMLLFLCLETASQERRVIFLT